MLKSLGQKLVPRPIKTALRLPMENFCTAVQKLDYITKSIH